MWKNIVEPGRPQTTVWRTRVACCIPKAHTHSGYITLITFLQQQGLHERASMLRYTYIACVINIPLLLPP